MNYNNEFWNTKRDILNLLEYTTTLTNNEDTYINSLIYLLNMSLFKLDKQCVEKEGEGYEDLEQHTIQFLRYFSSFDTVEIDNAEYYAVVNKIFYLMDKCITIVEELDVFETEDKFIYCLIAMIQLILSAICEKHEIIDKKEYEDLKAQVMLCSNYYSTIDKYDIISLPDDLNSKEWSIYLKENDTLSCLKNDVDDIF